MVDYFNCCCGACRMHVETVARVIAIFGFAFSLISATLHFNGSYLFEPRHISNAIGVFYLILALSYLSVLLALHQRRHTLFYPFLIFGAIALIHKSLGCLLFLYYSIAPPQWLVEEFDKRMESIERMLDPRTVLRATLALSLFSMAIFLAIYAWLYTIIWHAYKFVKIGEVQQTMEREAQKMRNYEQMV